MVKMGTVWDRTSEFLNDNIAAIVPIALLAFFVPASIEGNFEAAMLGAGPGLVLALRLLQLAFALVSLWGTLAIVAMAVDIASERSAGQIAARRFLPALIVSIAMFAALAVLGSPVLIALVAGGYDVMAAMQGVPQPPPSGPTAVFAALYLILFFIVILFLGARLIATTPVIVRENRMFGALAQSWRLTRGATWRIIGVILLYVIVSWVAQLAANAVFGSIFQLVAGGDTAGVSLAGVLTAVVVAAVETIFLVIAAAFTAKLYLALAARAGLSATADDA